MSARHLLQPDDEPAFVDPNYYWVEMMGRLRAGVDLAQAQGALAGPFAQWVASTATNDAERANLPTLRLEEGAAGLDSLRRQYAKPLYVLLLPEVCALAAVGLAIAVPTALASSRLIESFLFGTTPNDPRTVTVAALILLAAALLAGYGPARRASRVDPMVALRHE